MYIFLTFCTLLSFFFLQQQTKNGNMKKYFSYSVLPIFLYSLTYGFREGWGQDYDVYNALFLGVFRLDLENYEALFRFLIKTLRLISDSSLVLFVFVAAAFIFSYIFLLKENRDVLGLALSIFYLLSAYQASNLVRFFLALSIAYIGIDLILQKKWLLSILILSASVFIHAGIIIFIVMALLLVKFKLFFNMKYNIILYFISAVVSIENVQELFGNVIYRMLSSLDFGNLQLVKYADRDIVNNYILGTTWGEIEKSIFYLFFNFMFGLLFIYLGHRLINKMPNIKNIGFYYQIGVWGVVFGNIAANTEILYRVSIAFVYLSSLVCAYIIKYYRRLRVNHFIFALFLLSVIYMCFFSVKQIYSGFDVLYLWN